MDMEALKRLVVEGESERLELKKTTGQLRSAMTTLCALLNGSGGQ
ncbi:MAG: helix-turn-helix domain-containing protein [Isosphaeraceae bacterium]|jgi:ATP-dependent DNA helicase RecG